jgi:hypothetical protein
MRGSAARWILPVLLVVLTGCPLAAPSTPQDPPASTAPAPEAADQRPAPRMSPPLPPPAVPEPVRLDHGCRLDSDCAVKDVGSCCGAFPACVNRDSPTDPAAVRAECARQGRSASCGFRQLEHCACRQQRCVPVDKAPAGGWIDDPTAPIDPVR